MEQTNAVNAKNRQKSQAHEENGGTLAFLSQARTDVHAPKTCDWPDAIEQFLNAKEAANCAPKTLIYNRTQINQLAAWAKDQKLSLHGFKVQHFDRYLIYRMANRSERTVHHDFIVCRNFFRYCKKRKIVTVNGIIEMERAKPVKVVIPPPRDSNIIECFRGIEKYYRQNHRPEIHNMSESQREFCEARLRAICWICQSTGCRPNELLEIRLRDLPDFSDFARDRNPVSDKKINDLFAENPPDIPTKDTENKTDDKLLFRFTKTKKHRYAFLCYSSLWALREYLVHRKVSCGLQPDDYVFCSLYLDPKTKKSIKVQYTRILRTIHAVQDYVKISRFAFCGFRRSMISQGVKKHARQTQKMVGHEHFDTTEGYATTEEQTLREAAGEIKSLERLWTVEDAIAVNSPAAKKKRGPSIF